MACSLTTLGILAGLGSASSHAAEPAVAKTKAVEKTAAKKTTAKKAAAKATAKKAAPKRLPTDQPLARDVPRHHQINAEAKKGNINLIFLGDSITNGWAGNGRAIWKKRYEPRGALNAGIGGDVTQHVLWRLDNGNIDGLSPKLVVLMIGTNNFGGYSAEEIAVGIRAVVAKLRKKLPETKVLVLAVFPRGEKPDDPLRKKMSSINELIKDIGDGKHVHYMDINAGLMNKDGTQDRKIMPDLVHLTEKGYQIWADSIEDKVAELMGEKKK